jgi:hypothetical protein
MAKFARASRVLNAERNFVTVPLAELAWRRENIPKFKGRTKG